MLLFDDVFRATIPPLSTEERQALEGSLKRDGNRVPITVWRETGLVLDGHNRYDICAAHNIPLKPPELISLPDRDAAMIWLIDNQLARRNLKPYARIVLELKKEDILAEQAKTRMLAGKKISDPTPTLAQGETRDMVAKAAGVSHGTVAKVKAIESKATEEQKAKLKTGASTINQVFVAIRREEQKQKVKETQWPTGKYRVIYADPPWQYANIMPDRVTRPDDHYSTMSIEQLCALPIRELSTENSVLFLWATSPMLPEALATVKAWGFEYKTSFVWDKIKHNMGIYNSVRHELLLIAVKGSCQPDNNELFDSVVSIERTQHSAKPERFREIIDAMYPYGPRIELFARKQTKNWDVYGNQIAENE